VAVAVGPYAGYGPEPTADGHIGEKEYSPYLDIGYPQRVYWGDTHVDTSYSTVAAFFGINLPGGMLPTQQERAYTPAIWYTR